MKIQRSWSLGSIIPISIGSVTLGASTRENFVRAGKKGEAS